MILHFFVHEQTVAALETTSVPRCGSKGYLRLAFEFDESWDAFPAANGGRTVYLQKGEISAPVVLDESGCVEVDDYFTATGDGFMLMLVGVNGTVVCPTNVLSVSLDPSGEAWTTEPPDLDIPAYQQLVLLAQQAVAAAEEAKKLAYCLPIARGKSEDGATYVAAGETLPDVKPGSNGKRGKGKQIIFIPEYPKNKSESPALQINGGDLIQIRMRAPQNQSGNDQSPYATLPVPVGALMVGVPYTMTFCGMYWLVDSQIAQYACAEDQSQANLLREQARQLVLLSESDTIGMPIINSADGVGTAKARIKRSAEEDASPDVSGNVTLPTEARVKEMTEICVVNMTKNADGTYTADKTFADLKAAHDDGRTVVCSFDDRTNTWDSPYRLPVVDTTDVHMGFAGVIEPRQNYKIFAYVYINSVGMGYTATEIATNDGSLVHYTAENKTDAQKTQARANIGAEAAPVELTWNQETYPDVLDFLRTIESSGRYTFADDYGKYLYTLIRAYGDGIYEWYGILISFSGDETYIETKVYTGSDVGVLSPNDYYTPITRGALNGRVPETTAADAGKVLTVGASGYPAWTAVVNAEEVAV